MHSASEMDTHGAAAFDEDMRSAAVSDDGVRSSAAPDDDARSSVASGGDARSSAAPGHDARSSAAPGHDARSSAASESRAGIDALAAQLASPCENAEPGPRPRRRWHPLLDPAAVRPAFDPDAPFTAEMAHCETHGAYALNTRDANGTVRWHTPGCAACRRAAAAQGLMRRAAIAPRFAQCNFDNFTTATEAQCLALQRCRDYADDFAAMRERGTCLILRGAPGTGKNHLATAIARSVLARGCTVLNATAHEIIGRIREGWHPRENAVPRMTEREVIAEFAALDLLIIDEVGRAYRSRDGADSIELFNVIDARYRRLAPTLVISNLDREGIRAALGPAAYDRLREGGGKLANFDWPSHRGPAAETANPADPTDPAIPAAPSTET